MNYKMVCIDMDGTLLKKRKSISDESKKTIKEVADKGVKVVITTGRLYNNAGYYSDLVGASTEVIAANGAVIRTKRSDKVIFKKNIDKDICKKIMQAANECGLVLHLHTMDTIITNSYISNAIARAVFSTKDNKDFLIDIKTVKNEKKLNEVLEIYKDDIVKCIMFSISAERSEKFRKRLDELSDIVYYCSGHRSIEINAKDISKGNAVKFLAKHYGIKREEVICIGDNENDISMIEYAGLGIAMGNGIDKVKCIADYITDTNENDGVSKALKKFILNNG